MVRKRLMRAILPTCASRRTRLSAETKPEIRMTAARLVFTVVGVVLMIVPPYAFQMLNLVGRLQNVMIVAIELVSLVVGLALLYLAFRERGASERKS